MLICHARTGWPGIPFACSLWAEKEGWESSACGRFSSSYVTMRPPQFCWPPASSRSAEVRAPTCGSSLRRCKCVVDTGNGISEHCLILHLLVAKLQDWSASVDGLLWSALRWLCQPMAGLHIQYIASCSCCMLMVPAASAAH